MFINITYINNSASIYKFETPAEYIDKGVDETNRETWDESQEIVE